MVELTSATRRHLTRLFRAEEVAEVAALLETECSANLPLIGAVTPLGLERIRFAVLRCSGGDLARLRDAITLAKSDWRDVLVAAGFAARVEAHLSWESLRFDADARQSWREGKGGDTVRFRLGEEVLFRGLRRGQRGRVIDLSGLEPEPRYQVETVSGDFVEEHQCLLQKID